MSYHKLRAELKKQVANYELTQKTVKREQQADYDSLYEDKYYRNLVYSDVSDDAIDKMDLELVLVPEKSELEDIWNYYQIFTSSFPYNRTVGRSLKYLLRDKTTQKYLGILGLGSDVIGIGPRNNYIGWTAKNRKTKMNHLVNISCCVGLRPSCHNYNIGKLLCVLAFSDQVQRDYMDKYKNQKIAAFCTMGLNGKSAQYDRLKQLKFCGYTYGSCKMFSDDMYKKCCEFLKEAGYDMRGRPSVARRKLIMDIFDLDDYVMGELHPKGVYVGFTGKDAQAFLKEEIDDFTPEHQTVTEIVNWWKERWARQRYNHLKTIDNLKYDVELYRITTRQDRVNAASRRHEAELRRTIGEENYKKRASERNLKQRISVVTRNEISVDEAIPATTGPVHNYLCALYHHSGKILKTDDNNEEVLHLRSTKNIPFERLSAGYGAYSTKIYEKSGVYYIHIPTSLLTEPLVESVTDVIMDDDYLAALVDNVCNVEPTKKMIAADEGAELVQAITDFKFVFNAPNDVCVRIKDYIDAGGITHKTKLAVTHRQILPILERLVPKVYRQDWLVDVIRLAQHMIAIKPSKCTKEDYQDRLTIFNRMV